MGTSVVTASVKASVDGQELAVTGFVISLAINSIPTIELQCAPSKVEKGENSPLKVNVKRPTISDFSELYSDLSNKADSLDKKCNVTITLETGTGAKGKEELKLKGWILASVGMSSVSATSAPYMSVVLMHPICNLTKVGSIYETLKSTSSVTEGTQNANNFIEIVEKVYENVRTGKDKFWKAPNKYPTIFREQLGVGDFKPSNHLVSKPENDCIFLAGKANGMDADEDNAAKAVKKCIAAAIGDLVLPMDGGSSTWDMITSMCGMLLLWVTQDDDNNFTTDKLVIGPAAPWKEQDIVLNEEKCFQTELQGMDPFRITGVMCRKMGPYNSDIGLGFMKNANPNKEDPVAEILYVPDGVDTEKASGRIMKTSAPSILDAAYRKDAPHGKSISTGMAGVENADSYNKYIEKYCKALYEITAASMVKSRALMAIGFKDGNGKLILPGRTCKFMSGGKEIYYGHIMAVTHSMTTSGGCSTAVSMAYVRPGKNYIIGGKDAIKSSSVNAAYG